jgi:hypothetical protein
VCVRGRGREASGREMEGQRHRRIERTERERERAKERGRRWTDESMRGRDASGREMERKRDRNG